MKHTMIMCMIFVISFMFASDFKLPSKIDKSYSR